MKLRLSKSNTAFYNEFLNNARGVCNSFKKILVTGHVKNDGPIVEVSGKQWYENGKYSVVPVHGEKFEKDGKKFVYVYLNNPPAILHEMPAEEDAPIYSMYELVE